MLLFNPPIRKKLGMPIFGYSRIVGDLNLPIREYASKWTILSGDLETYITMSWGNSAGRWKIDSQVPERYDRCASSLGSSQLQVYPIAQPRGGMQRCCQVPS
jgi:hypothetical protein